MNYEDMKWRYEEGEHKYYLNSYWCLSEKHMMHALLATVVLD